MLTIYLAGGMHTDWRKKVKEAVPNAIYLDPTTHGLTDEGEYTQWDLIALHKSDIVLGYLERSNPAGLGLMFELGYAIRGETETIFVNEWEGKTEDRYCGMARASATKYYSSLDSAIAYLQMATHAVRVDMRSMQREEESILTDEDFPF